MPTPQEIEAEKIKQEFKGILDNFYESLPEDRKKFDTDKRLKEFDIVVVRVLPKEK